MKRRLGFLLIVCLMAMVLTLGGYSENVVLADESTHTVTFSYNLDRVRKYIIDENNEILGSLNTVTQNISHGKYATTPELANEDILQYYSYEWTVDGERVNVNNYPITRNTNFVAKWTPKEYKVYFKYGDYVDEITNKVDFVTFNLESQRIYLYKPNRPNYIFKGWYVKTQTNGLVECLFIPPKAAGDKVLYAQFSPVEYYIDYHTKATNNNPRGYNVEDEDILLESPTLYGHIFKGWFLDSNFKNPVTTIDSSVGGNIDLYPKWELETYEVTYILPNGITKTVTAEYGSTAELPRLDKSMFEIVKTSVSRKNITEDTTIKIEYVNIWYVYVIAIVVGGGTIALIIVLKKKRENTHNNLRAMYYSNMKGKRK